jgi:integrase
MARIRLRYIKEYRDRHGKVRRYLRRRGLPNVALPGDPGSPEFMAAYNAAVASLVGAPRLSKQREGTIARVVTDFYRSAAFMNLKPNSRSLYRIVLDKISKEHGHRLVRDMPQQKARRMIEEIGETRRGMANLTRAILHKFMAYAIASGLRSDNPISGIETYSIGTRHTWTDAQLSAYEKRWPLGTRERLAYALLLYTDQRGGDVVRMRRQDILGNAIHVIQEKTGKELLIEIHPALARAMKAGPTKGFYLIGDQHGRPIKRPALTRLIVRAAKAAGLSPECLPHGLRKAMQRRLAEHGASAKELQAISGHVTLKETERYTQAADQARLARAAIRRLPDEG